MTRDQRILSLAGIVHATARRYPGDRDDLRQVAWVGAIRAVDTWDGTGALTGWAWTCCNWEISKHLRSLKPKAGPGTRSRKHALQPGDEIIVVPLMSHDKPRDDNQLEAVPDRVDAHRMLDRLTPRDRAIVLLLTEYTQREVASALGCGQATIGRVVTRARLAA